MYKTKKTCEAAEAAAAAAGDGDGGGGFFFWEGCGALNSAPDGCCDYYIEFSTRIACGTDQPMSAGTVAAIVICCLLGGYVVLGIAYGYYRDKKFAHPHAAGIRRGVYLVGDCFGFALNGCAAIRDPRKAQAPGAGTAFAGELATFKPQKGVGLGGIENGAMVSRDDQQAATGEKQETGYQSI